MNLPPTGARRVKRASWIGAVVVAAASSLGASGRALPSQQTRSDTMCARPPASHDSIRVVVTAIARVDSVNVEHPPTLSPDFLAFVVEAVRAHFVPPAHLDLSSMAGGMPRPPAEWLTPRALAKLRDERTTPLLAVDAYFDINAGGAPRNIRIGKSTMAGALAQSVESAIRAIVPEDYGLIPQGADGARVHFHLEAAPADVATEQPFFATWLPVYRIEKDPVQRSHGIFPMYPVGVRNAGVSDTVDVAFALGADGHVIPGTVDILAARFKEFIDAVMSVLMASSYQPLVAGGCRLTSTVSQKFTFTVDR